MKTSNTFLLFFIFSTFILFSCQKDISSENGTIPGNIVNAAGDSNYLNKAYSLYDVGAGVDTQEIGVCHYDASKRIISINDSAITPAGMQHVLSYYYYYSGSDTIPYKSMSVFSQTIPVGFDTTISYHFYDTQQRLIRDSVIEHAAIGDISKQISTYNYSGNTIYGQTVISYPGTPDPDYLLRDTAVVDAAGNLISDKKYFFNGTAYEADITYQYAYDTHHDPFARLTLVKSLKQFSWDAQERMLENGGKYPNNVIAETSFQPGQTPVTAPTIYTYNAAGYPLTETDGTSTDKTIYTYRHL